MIANGGVATLADALACLAYTGADGVMSSEALLENPKLFSVEGDALFQSHYIPFQLDTVQEYRTILLSYPLPRPILQVVRSHLFKLLFRFLSGARNADLRTRLAEGTLEEMLQVVDDLTTRLLSAGFATTMAAVQPNYLEREEERRAIEGGWLGATRWYMRHRDEKAAQRVLSQPRAKAR